MDKKHMNWDDIQGWLTPQEGAALQWLAAIVGGGLAVNIGCWKGRSVALLATCFEKVVAIDHFKGSPDEPKLMADPDLPRLREVFDQNMETCGIEGKVVVIEMDNVGAAKEFKGEADLVLIDGGHDYESVKADIKAWWLHVGEDGFLCVHDYQEPSFPEVAKAVDELDLGGNRLPGTRLYAARKPRRPKPKKKTKKAEGNG